MGRLLYYLISPFVWAKKRKLAEFRRLDVTAELVEHKEPLQDSELRIRLRFSWKGENKPFAEIRYTDLPKVTALFGDSERWVKGLLSEFNYTG